MSKQQMTPADAAWLHMGRSTNLMIVNGMMQLDGPVEFSAVKEIIRERMVERFPRFRQRVVEPRLGVGLPSWEDDPDFDLDLHLHRRALPTPGDAAALREFASELAVTPLDPAKPLWEIYVMEDYGAGTAVLARMHHCIADGVALARVFLSLTDRDPGAGISQPLTEPARRSRINPAARGLHLLDGAFHESLEMVTHPRRETRAALDGLASNARALSKLLLTGPDTHTVLKEPPAIARRLTWCEPVPLEEIKAIGHATGTTVNDVVVTALAGALRSYLANCGSLVQEIRAVIPFNLRPLDQPLAPELGNRFGLVELPLPIGVADPSERLGEVHRRMDEIKRSPEGPLSYQMLGLVGRIPSFIERRIVNLMSAVETAVITNVPGPTEPVYLAGVKVTDLLAWVPTGGNIGVGVSIISYDGAVTVAVQTAANVVPDPDSILSEFADEMRDLARLHLNSQSRTRSPATTRSH